MFKMKERELRKLTGDVIDDGYSSIDGADRKQARKMLAMQQ